jgi:hypothetical protein
MKLKEKYPNMTQEDVDRIIQRRKKKRLMRRIARANRLKIQDFMKMSRGRKNVPTTMLGGLL